MLAKTRESTIELATLYAIKIAPQYQPVLVEQPVTIPLESTTHDLLAVLDLVDDADVITDFKTTGRRMAAEDAHHSTQLTIQAAAFHSYAGHAASGLQLHVVQTWGKRPSQRKIPTTRGARDFAVLAARVNAALTTISVGAFMPAPVGAWWCSPKWCGYWSTCPYVNGDRRRE